MDTENTGEKPGFLGRYGVAILVVGIFAGATAALIGFLGKKAPVKRAAEAPVVRITPPTPPPPPPPKPPEPKPEEPKNEPEPEKMAEPEPTPEAEAKPADPAPADAAMGTSIQGNGDDGFGLAYNRTGGGNTIGGGGRGGVATDSRALWTAYAGRSRTKLLAALAANKTTRAAELTVKLRLWADATGKITRVELPEPTGNAELDAALRNEAFAGLSLGEAPPAGLPMPMVVRLTGRRP